ncbi:hypothetical protein E0H73_42290 [Kribbella pittospori]|uniref:Uncharacterized protein n=1 Tax=Kribbella pittospori TaxID=722689 RepID=A0A4R0JWE5_9ACTN|nr:hypothetical protein [Kribbella pittospori]TCC49576.1 hypothetical protein E0H73_42290 [Kribbella pittospori]
MKTHASTITLARRQGMPHRLARPGVLRELQSPSQVFSNLTPNSHASITSTLRTVREHLPFSN